MRRAGARRARSVTATGRSRDSTAELPASRGRPPRQARQRSEKLGPLVGLPACLMKGSLRTEADARAALSLIIRRFRPAGAVGPEPFKILRIEPHSDTPECRLTVRISRLRRPRHPTRLGRLRHPVDQLEDVHARHDCRVAAIDPAATAQRNSASRAADDRGAAQPNRSGLTAGALALGLPVQESS
jgi:hypothetical protein